MMLGLLWKILVKFQIDELPRDETALEFSEEDSSKNSLLKWVKERLKNYKNIPITDFQSSFSDGMAFLGLIHSQNASLVNFGQLDPVIPCLSFSL
jgi:hypothetical protein